MTISRVVLTSQTAALAMGYYGHTSNVEILSWKQIDRLNKLPVIGLSAAQIADLGKAIVAINTANKVTLDAWNRTQAPPYLTDPEYEAKRVDFARVLTAGLNMKF